MKKYVCRFSATHELQSTALGPDYGLFIGYQMPADKHKGLNTCLCLLRKNLKNLAEGNHSVQYMKHRSNTEYCEGASRPRPFNLFIYFYLFIFIYLFLFIYFYLFIFIYLFLFIYFYLFIFIYLFLFIYFYLFIFIYLFLFIYFYLFIFFVFISMFILLIRRKATKALYIG